MQIVDIVVTFILFLIIFILFFKNISLYFKNNDLVKKSLQAEIDKFILIDNLQKENSSEDKGDDGFIKFITESREHAFNYIEDSQKLIKDFVTYVDKNIEHLKNNNQKDLKYRVIIKDLQDYSEKLKKLLPRDE